MDTVVTLAVNPVKDRLSAEYVASVKDVLRDAGAAAGNTDILAKETAADIFFSGLDIDPARRAVAAALSGVPVDFAVQAAKGRRKKLLVADMDSTIITIECIDELASFAGLKDRVAAITESAMRGELDFEGALRERVTLLKGLPESILQRTFDERLRLTNGAQELVKTMTANGALAILVSGGFTFFAERVANLCGFQVSRANTLGLSGGLLTGEVIPPIVNAAAKKAALLEFKKREGLASEDILAVGDGANDIPMIEEAGLGVAYHAKPKTAAAAHAAVNFASLEALLYFQGYRAEDFVSARPGET